MAKSESKANWLPINLEGLSKPEAAAYAAMVKARKAFVEAEEAFEGLFEKNAREAKKLSASEELKFAYRYGPAVAIVPLEKQDVKKKNGKFF
jgi:hypothetical protein